MILMILEHPVWEMLRQHWVRNFGEYMTFLAAVFIASVCMMPKSRPRNIDDLWTWLRDTLQTAVPAARAQQAHFQSTTTTSPTESSKVVTSDTPVTNPNEPPKGTPDV